jgi:hypothetical protein
MKTLHTKRLRNRGNGSRGGGRRSAHGRNPNQAGGGSDGKSRGSASRVLERYLTLARDANSAGDRIAAENYYQHAEHYYRVLNGDRYNRQPAARATETENSENPTNNSGDSQPGKIIPDSNRN